MYVPKSPSSQLSTCVVKFDFPENPDYVDNLVGPLNSKNSKEIFHFVLQEENMNKLPSSLRQLYKSGNHFNESTFGLCPGFLQANMVMISSEFATDFEQFCHKNHSACPLIYRSNVGEVSASFLAVDSDIRTDLSTYDVYKNGEFIKSVSDLKDMEWNDKVSFYLGCSFSFDDNLVSNGINLRTEGNVSMYLTNIDCIPVGPFNAKMVVSMRPIPKDKLQAAAECTLNYDFAHGAPINFGSPQDIGITDIGKVDFGAPSEILENEIPVFWACGVTSGRAIKSAKLPISFTHHPGSMFVCDIKASDTLNFLKNKSYPRPSVIAMDDENMKYSLLSEKALQSLNGIEFEISEDLGNRGIEELIVRKDFAKAVLSLCKDGRNIGIITGFPCMTDGSPLEENDGIAGAIYIARALVNLNKTVTFIVDSGSSELQTFLKESISRYVENVDVISIGKEFNEKDTTFLFDEESKPIFSHLLAIERPSPSTDDCYNTMKARDITKFCDPTHILFKQALSSGKIITIGIGDGGNELGMGKVYNKIVEHVQFGKAIASSVSCDYLITCGVSNWGGFSVAAGMKVLSSCPVFQRFKNHGLESSDSVQHKEVILSPSQDEDLNKLIAEKGFRDGISGSCHLTVDNLDYYEIHKPKFQKIRDIASSFVQSMKEFS